MFENRFTDQDLSTKGTTKSDPEKGDELECPQGVVCELTVLYNPSPSLLSGECWSNPRFLANRDSLGSMSLAAGRSDGGGNRDEDWGH